MGVFEQFPYTNFHNLNLDWILKTMKEYVATVEALKEEIDKINKEFPNIYEKSVTITNNRKLSPKGDFTGTIHGRSALTTIAQIDTNRDNIQYIANQFSDGQTGLVIDGGFFEDSGIRRNYNGGMF
jgi:predicted metal-dependent hydrolase